MDLTRFRPIALLAAVLSFGCSEDNPASFSDDAVLLPATLLEALTIADGIAREWNPEAFPTTLGGDFTVMDADGAARNHSFEFHARFGFQLRRLTVHLINGTPWTLEAVTGGLPPQFPDLDVIDSREAVHAALSHAELLNQESPGSIPGAQQYAARLLSVPVYPEPSQNSTPDAVAWRVDFLELDAAGSDDSTPVWWSLARFYFDPWTGQSLGPPEVPATGREIYPYP